MWCISSASFFVMSNGSPHGFFCNSRGLTYLFFLVMEVLNHLVVRAIDWVFFRLVWLGEVVGKVL